MKKYKIYSKSCLIVVHPGIDNELQRFLGQGSRRPAYHGDDFHGQDKD